MRLKTPFHSVAEHLLLFERGKCLSVSRSYSPNNAVTLVRTRCPLLALFYLDVERMFSSMALDCQVYNYV